MVNADSRPVRVMFVCLGNICRSPLAEGVFRHLVREEGLEEDFLIASSGTGAWHVGEPPDHRMLKTAAGHGISLAGQKAQKFDEEHLYSFDHILAMDRSNMEGILYLDPTGEHESKVRLFRSFDPAPDTPDVPDPYYGGRRGFEQVFDIVMRTSARLLDQLAEQNDLGGSETKR